MPLKKSMKVFVDTNVVLDVLIGRKPFMESSSRVLEICGDERADGFLAAHSVTNIYYILRKHFDNDACRDILLNLFELFEIEQIDTDKLKSALEKRDFKDFEDCLQAECAVAVQAEYIITRNKKDFTHSEVPCLTPDEFCALFQR